METVAERFKKQMIELGMFDNQADAALKEAIPQIDELMPDYKEIWAQSADSYPVIIYKVIWVSLRPLILSWIDANIPKLGIVLCLKVKMNDSSDHYSLKKSISCSLSTV